MTTQLNLPIWQTNSKSVDRVSAARAKANKTASDIIKSIPNNEDKAELLHKVMNKMLSAGTIKSLEEFYELTGNGNPNPTKAEQESALDSSGYTVVNGSNFFKLLSFDDFQVTAYSDFGNSSLVDNVEAIRMLYMAGLSIDSIRKELAKLKEGDVIVLNCSKVIKKYPKVTYNELLDKYPDFRGYPEYITVQKSNTYAVCDTLGGNDSLYILYVKQDTTPNAFLSCKPVEFPIKGTLTIDVNGTSYDYPIDASDSNSLIAQLELINSPLSFYYDNGLTISSNSSFSFPETEDSSLLYSLGIVDSLNSLKESAYNGYSGAEFSEGHTFPHNIVVKKSGYSKANTRKIYQSLKDNGVPEEVCNKYLLGKSLYYELEEKTDNIKKAIKEDPFNFDIIKSCEEYYYKDYNTRFVGTTLNTINRLLKLSDEDLEYLLRFRLDVTSIDPCCTNEEARDNLLKKASDSSRSHYYKKGSTETDSWKSLAAISRTVSVYLEIASDSSNAGDTSNYSFWLDTTYEFLDSSLDFLNKDLLREYDWANGTWRTEETLGMNVATTVNWRNSFSISRGLQSFASIRSEIDTSFLDEFEQDMLIIQAYLDAAFNAFKGICDKIAGIIKIINSSLGITADLGGNLALDGGSLLQCSLSIDLQLNIPIYIPLINDIILGLVAMLEAVIDAVVSLENAILCPVQSLLDKYVNTKKFPLPCKIKYDVPLISGIDAYLKGYLTTLNTLKFMCKTVKRDGDWVKFKSMQMPGSVELLVTKSADCKES